MKKNKQWAFVVLLVILYSGCGSKDLHNKDNAEKVPSLLFEDRLAGMFHLDSKEIVNLKNSGREETEIVYILVIATASGIETKSIAAELEQGSTFEDISQNHGLDKDIVDSETSRILKYIRSGTIGKETEDEIAPE